MVYQYGYNIVTNTEVNILTYKGTVQIRPSQMVNGKWTVAGYIRYFRENGADSGRVWTPSGKSRSDNRILTASKTWFDNPIPGTSKTQFRYGFTYADPGQILSATNPSGGTASGGTLVEYETYLD